GNFNCKKYPESVIVETQISAPKILNEIYFRKSKRTIPANIGAKVRIIGTNLLIIKAGPPYLWKNSSAIMTYFLLKKKESFFLKSIGPVRYPVQYPTAFPNIPDSKIPVNMTIMETSIRPEAQNIPAKNKR